MDDLTMELRFIKKFSRLHDAMFCIPIIYKTINESVEKVKTKEEQTAFLLSLITVLIVIEKFLEEANIPGLKNELITGLGINEPTLDMLKERALKIYEDSKEQ